MSDKNTTFLSIVRHGCPELEHIADPLEKLEMQWAKRFQDMSNRLASSPTIHQTAFSLAKHLLVEQVRTQQVPNGQMWDMLHPVYEAFDCGLVYFDMTDEEVEFIEMQTALIKELLDFDYFAEEDNDSSGNQIPY